MLPGQIPEVANIETNIASAIGQMPNNSDVPTQPSVRHLSFLCHDLNNNLSSVLLRLALLKELLVQSPSSVFAEELSMLELAEQAISHTTNGMRCMLTYEQLRHSKRPPVHPLALRQLIESVAWQHQYFAQTKGVNILVHIPDSTTVTCNKDLLVLVMQNLLGNAVKFSSAGTVRIWAGGPGQTCGGGFTLHVSDEGCGIPRHRHQQIFEAFERGSTGNHEGVGLGLAIASQAISLLGGRLTVESTVGIGSTFTVVL